MNRFFRDPNRGWHNPEYVRDVDGNREPNGNIDPAYRGNGDGNLDQPRRGNRLGMRPDETKIYGVNACLKVFERRPDAIVRAYISTSVARRFGHMMRHMASMKRAYHLIEDDAELERVTQSQHHGGVCLLIKKRPVINPGEFLAQTAGLERDCVVALEDVSNPHNVGAVMRSCANFGVRGLLLRNATVAQSGAAVRTAEGGAEHVEIVESPWFDEAMQAFRAAGYGIVTTSAHEGVDLFEAALPPRAVFLFGEESRGLSDEALATGDVCVRVPGTGNVESLNVGISAAIILAEWWRRTHR
ncbi:MAG TPA: tRNA/rRNA methyltransferase [Gammaproteobacteria bacterium]|nr:tRNA/rRNA methyltransferase [Gammaproteobacteria bacterium]